MWAHYLLPTHVKFLKYSLDLIQELSHPHLTPKPQHKGAGEWRLSLKYEPKNHQIEMQSRKGLRSHSEAIIWEVMCFWSLASAQKRKMLHVISTLRLVLGTALGIDEHPSQRGKKAVLREKENSFIFLWAERGSDTGWPPCTAALLGTGERVPAAHWEPGSLQTPYLTRGVQPTEEAAVGNMLQAQSTLLFLLFLWVCRHEYSAKTFRMMEEAIQFTSIWERLLNDDQSCYDRYLFILLWCSWGNLHFYGL